MDDTINNWGGQEMSLADAAKMLRALSEEDLSADSPERREAILAEQNRAMKMGGILLTGVNKLTTSLKKPNRWRRSARIWKIFTASFLVLCSISV